jgi:hypothetical protein
LKSFEADLLEQPPVVDDRSPPLLIVIAEIQWIAARPPAPGDAIVMTNQTVRAHRPES